MQIKLIKQAFRYYARNLPPTDKTTIKKFIEMIAFGMKLTLIHSRDECFNYKGVIGEDGNDNAEDENGLVIGAYEVAFCADVGATYVYKINRKILDNL